MTVDDRSASQDLYHYLFALRRRKWVVLLAVAVVAATAVLVSYAQTPVYRASAQLLISPPASASSVLSQSSGGAGSSQDIETQMQIITSRPVMDSVAKQLGAAPSIVVSQVGTSNVVQLTATSTIPRQASEVANAYAAAYLGVERAQSLDNLQAAGTQIQAKIDDLQKQVDAVNSQESSAIVVNSKDPTIAQGLASQRDSLLTQQGLLKQQLTELQLSASIATSAGQLVTPAVAPTVPFTPRHKRNLLLGVIVGMLFGIAVAFVLDYLDDSIGSRADAERAAPDIPDLGLIPRVQGWKDSDQPVVVSLTEPKSAPAEAYRTLRTSIQFASLDHPLRIIQVTSAAAEEGKTTTLANLGVALAGAGQRVCMCCCDLRRPRIHGFFGLGNKLGVTSVILGDVSMSAAIQDVPRVNGLSLLASGPLPPNPSELLASPRAAEVIRALAATFDVVLLDSPPVLPVTDSAIISAVADGTIVVVSMGRSTRRALGRTVEILRQVHAPLIGTVLNGVSEDTGDVYYRYGGRYYESHEEEQDQAGVDLPQAVP